MIFFATRGYLLIADTHVLAFALVAVEARSSMDKDGSNPLSVIMVETGHAAIAFKVSLIPVNKGEQKRPNGYTHAV
jgi:hypothetical protein